MPKLTTPGRLAKLAAIVSALALSLALAPSTYAAGLTLSPDANVLYPGATQGLSLNLATWQGDTRADFYLVSASGQRWLTRTLDLPSGYGASASLGTALASNLEPGTYHYLAVLSDGREFRTRAFTVLSAKKMPKPKIESLDLTFGLVDPTAGEPEGTYDLSVHSTTGVKLQDLVAEISMKCSRRITLGEGDYVKHECGKKWKTVYYQSGGAISDGWYVSSAKLDKDVKLQVRITLWNSSGKKLDREEKTIILSSR